MRATARHHLVGIPGKQGFFKAMLDRLLNLWNRDLEGFCQE